MLLKSKATVRIVPANSQYLRASSADPERIIRDKWFYGLEAVVANNQKSNECLVCMACEESRGTAGQDGFLRSILPKHPILRISPHGAKV